MRTLLFLFVALLFSTNSEGKNLRIMDTLNIPPIYISGGTFTLSEDCTVMNYLDASIRGIKRCISQ